MYTVNVTPPWVDETFGANGFYVFGRLAFIYTTSAAGAFQGPTHWLEAKSGLLFPERTDPIAFAIYLKPGVQITWEVDVGSNTDGVGAAVGGTLASFLLNKIPPGL